MRSRFSVANISIASRLKSGLPNTLATTVLIAIAGMVSGLILARSLGPSHRGEFATVIVWASVVTLLGELGLGFSLSYHVGKYEATLSGLWTLSILVSLVWGGGLAIISAVALTTILHFSPTVAANLQRVMVSVLPVLLIGYQSQLLLGAGHVRDYNLVRISTGLFYTGGIVFVAAAGWAGVGTFTTAYVFSMGLSMFVAVALVHRKLRPSWSWEPGLVRPVFSYGMRTYLSSLMSQANIRLDQGVMTILVSSEQLGLYVVAVAMSRLFGPLYNALAVVVLPRVIQGASLVAGGRQAVRHLQLGLISGIPLAILGSLLMPWLLPLLFGVDYRQAIVPAQILMIAAVFQGTNTVLGNGLRGLGCPGRTAWAEGLGLCVTLGLLVALLPRWGAMGAAITSLAAYALVMLLQLVFLRQAAGLAWHDFRIPNWTTLVPDLEMLKDLVPGRFRRMEP